MSASFAFRSGRLDRAATLRGTPGISSDPRARTYLFWQGKLLAFGTGLPEQVELSHGCLADSRDPPVFLGETEEGPRFAADLAGYHPHEDAAAIGQFTDQSLQTHPDFPDARFVEIRSLMATLDVAHGECIALGRAMLGWHATHRFCANCGTPSVAEQSGWRRRCPTCGTQHFPRTDPVVIMAVTHADRLLLGRGPSWPERMYSLLAGFVEPGETIESAVRREVFEETAIRVGSVRYVACQPWPFPMSLMFGCTGEALSEDITLDPVEMADARWVGRDEVKRMIAGDHPDLAAPRAGSIANAIIRSWAAGTVGDAALWDVLP